MRDLIEGRHAIFFWRNLGNGPLHFYWTALLVKGLGLPLNYLTLKTATSICGLLVAPALFLLGRELGGVWLGLVAAGFGAWSKWSVALSRQGLEYIYPIPLTALVLWALLRYQRRGDRGSVLAAGAAIGIGLSTYLSFRIVPLLVPLALGVALFDRRRQGRRWRTVADGLLVAGTSAILFLPVLKFAFFGENRSFFWSRIATRATDTERALAGSLWRVFTGNLWNMAKAFHWQGSSTWTVLQSDDPFLDIVSGGLFLAGLVLLVRLALRGSWRWATLLPALFLLTLPTTLSIAYPEENPSLNRAGPSLPVVFLLVGLAFAHLWNGFLRERVMLRVAGLCALLAGAGYSVQMNAEAYFVRLGESYDALIEHALEIAAVIGRYRSHGVPIRQSYLLAVDYWVDARIIALELGDPSWSDTNNVLPGKVPEGLTARPLVFVYRANDKERVKTLERLYPGGTTRIIPQSHHDRDFGVYVIR
jgi:4-amino-4-deoxy-L-arabinose transferase-like glycosyltransferase